LKNINNFNRYCQ